MSTRSHSSDSDPPKGAALRVLGCALAGIGALVLASGVGYILWTTPQLMAGVPQGDVRFPPASSAAPQPTASPSTTLRATTQARNSPGPAPVAVAVPGLAPAAAPTASVGGQTPSSTPTSAPPSSSATPTPSPVPSKTHTEDAKATLLNNLREIDPSFVLVPSLAVQRAESTCAIGGGPALADSLILPVTLIWTTPATGMISDRDLRKVYKRSLTYCQQMS